MAINIYAISGLINFLTGVILAVLVIAKNRKNPKNISFFILAMLVGLWSLCYFFWQITTESEWIALFWARALMVFTIMIPAAYFHFTLALTETLENRQKQIAFVYLYFYLFLLADATPFFINKVGPVMGFKFWPMATPIMSAWLISFLICVAYSSILLVKKYKKSSGVTKIQLKYVSTGVIIAFICGSLNFAPWYKIPLPPVYNFFVPIYVVFMAYAITRYRLMNIRTLTRNVVICFFIAVFAYGFFYGLAFLYKIMFGSVFAKEGFAAGLIAAPIFALLIYSTSKPFLKFLDKHIFYSIYIYEQAIRDARINLMRHPGLNGTANVIIDTLEITLQAERVAVLAHNPSKKTFSIVKKTGSWKDDIFSLDYGLFSGYFKNNPAIITREELEEIIENEEYIESKKNLHLIENVIFKNNISLCVPLKNDGKLLGIIIAGTKKYEGDYSKEDFDLLETIAESAQASISNA